MQLDIFEHSREVMLRNDVVAALERDDAPAPRNALNVLRDGFADDASLPAYEVLVAALERRDTTPFAGHEAARAARLSLHNAIDPAARQTMGAEPAAAWLALRWRELALRASGLPFRAEHSEEHAAPLWLRAGDARAAIDAVARIESWRRIPAPLGWMAEAQHRVHGLAAAWPLLAELACLSPQRFDALCRRLEDGVLVALRRRFSASFEGDGGVADLAWFAAWTLTEQPALAVLLDQARPSVESPPEQALRLMLELLRLERQGRHHEIVERRRRLRGLSPALFSAYMATR